MSWTPHVTVATVVENDGKFLLVEEIKHGHRVLNQPAGHLEEGEDLIQAAIRETLEETQWQVEILGVVALGLYVAPANGVTYHRSCFYGRPMAFQPESLLDPDIEQAVWLSFDEIKARRHQLRSPLVLESVARYLDGHRYPLSMVYGSNL